MKKRNERLSIVLKTTRVPENLMKVIEYRVNKEGLDESTVIRQLIQLGVRQYISQLYKESELSLREASELLGVSLRETLEILWKEGVKGNILVSTQQKALKLARKTKFT